MEGREVEGIQGSLLKNLKQFLKFSTEVGYL